MNWLSNIVQSKKKHQVHGQPNNATNETSGMNMGATNGCNNAGDDDELLQSPISGKFTERTSPSSDSFNDNTSLTKEAGTIPGSSSSNTGSDDDNTDGSNPPIVERRRCRTTGGGEFSTNVVVPPPPPPLVENFMDHEIIVESDLRPESRHRRRWIRSFGYHPTSEMKVRIESTNSSNSNPISNKGDEADVAVGNNDHDVHKDEGDDDEENNGIEVDDCANNDRGGRKKRAVWCAWCSRNGLLVWAIVATVLLIINLAVTSGMFQRNNKAQIAGLSMEQSTATTACGASTNGNNNNANIVATNSTTTTENENTSDNTSNNQSSNNENGNGDKNDEGSNNSQNNQTTSGNTSNPTSTGSGKNQTTSTNRCGCSTCTDAVWNKPVGNPASTCGQRVEYLMSAYGSHYITESQACRQIAFEFPCDCGSCDPNRCGIYKEEFVTPKGWTPKDDYTVPSTAVPRSVDDSTYSMYCYPPEGQRITYTNGWNNGYSIQVKQGLDNPICGPGNNRFVPDNVIYDTTNAALKLQYKNAAAGEVRVTLANDDKFTYGTYRFEIGSVTVSNAAGDVVSNILPKELVFGMFTWDDTEDYAIHENYNHEVDIEISKWNCETNADLQFLVQPPGYPQMQRYFTGGSNTKYSQQNHVYEFTWGPGQIDWYTSAGNGEEFTLKTSEALYMDLPDYIQCMPDKGMQTEVRINLWNMLGAVQPAALASDDVVEVVISNFTFTPLTSGPLYVEDGGFCTKHCQCNYPTSTCDGGICTPSSSSSN